MIKKHKGKILFGVIVVLLLVISFFTDGTHEQQKESLQTTRQEVALEAKPSAIPPEQGESPEKTKEKAEVSAKKAEEAETQKTSEKSVYASSEKPEESAPAQPEETLACTLVVRCDAVFEHLDNLKDGKEEILPKDGIILNAENISFSEGESAFDVLKRELRARGIHFEFVETPMYNSVYIEGIANLYEFDCGNLSGWMYQVNGIRPTYGCSQYILKNQDRIEFFFSADWRE